MIQLANSGVAGLPMAANTASGAGALAPGFTSIPLLQRVSFANLLPDPNLETLPAEQPDAAIPIIETSGGLPHAAVSELPVGNPLPVAGTVSFEQSDPAQSVPSRLPMAAPLAREDGALQRPAVDRLVAMSQAQPLEASTLPASEALAQQTAAKSDANRQISGLAMAAAQVLLAGKNHDTVETKASPIAKPLAQIVETTKPIAGPAFAVSSKFHLPPITADPEVPIKARSQPASSQSESGAATVRLSSETKSLTSRPANETSGQPQSLAQSHPQPQSAAPPSTQITSLTPSAAPGSAPVAPMEISAPQHSVPETKATTPITPRPDQQATLDRVADQTMQAREATQMSNTQIRVPHEQFGAIRMQLELAGAGLKVTLGNNDPGFAQSVQLALAERVAPVADTARADSNSARQDGSAPNNGHSSSGFQLGQNPSQQRAQSRADSGLGEPAFEPQRANSEPDADSTSSNQSGLFA